MVVLYAIWNNCDVTPRDARPTAADQRAPLDVWSCNFIEQIEEVENSSTLTGKETRSLVTVEGDSFSQVNLGMYRCHYCNYMSRKTRAGRRQQQQQRQQQS